MRLISPQRTRPTQALPSSSPRSVPALDAASLASSGSLGYAPTGIKPALTSPTSPAPKQFVSVLMAPSFDKSHLLPNSPSAVTARSLFSSPTWFTRFATAFFNVEASAAAHNRAAAAIALRWVVQQGFPIVTSSDSREYDEEDLAIFSFNLTEAEMVKLAAV